MTVQEIVARYYDAWQHRAGDFSDVPLADDFRFVGPIASFDSAEGFRAMARQAGRRSPPSRSATSSSTATGSARSSTGRWSCRWPR